MNTETTKSHVLPTTFPSQAALETPDLSGLWSVTTLLTILPGRAWWCGDDTASSWSEPPGKSSSSSLHPAGTCLWSWSQPGNRGRKRTLIHCSKQFTQENQIYFKILHSSVYKPLVFCFQNVSEENEFTLFKKIGNGFLAGLSQRNATLQKLICLLHL